MENLYNEEKNETVKITTKSQILLPIIFALTLAFVICSTTIADFNDGLDKIIIWGYFIVVIIYIGISLFDAILHKKDKNKLIFVSIMSSLTLIVDILFIIFINR